MNSFGKISFVLTSFSPVLLTLWFSQFSDKWCWQDGLIFLILAFGLAMFCLLIIHLIKKQGGPLPVKIKTVATSDKEVMAFLIIYLVPLINKSALDIKVPVLVFILLIMFISVLTTNTYHFNPVLGIFGYHFYEITTDDEIKYILITRKDLKNTKAVNSVKQISEYMLLDIGR